MARPPWLRQLRQGSFQAGPFPAAKFSAGSMRVVGGRRTVVHELTNRDAVTIDDLGKLGRVFQFDAFIVDEDYLPERDLLVKHLEFGGTGQVVHPLWGRFRVRLTEPFTVQETVDEGGMARFTLTFTLEGITVQPVTVPNAAFRIARAAKRLRQALVVSFAKGFSVTNAPGDLVNQVTNRVQLAASALRIMRGKLAANLNTLDDLDASIDSFSNELNTLIQTPTVLANKFVALAVSIWALITTAARNAEDQATFILVDPFDDVEAVPADDVISREYASGQQADTLLENSEEFDETNKASVPLDLNDKTLQRQQQQQNNVALDNLFLVTSIGETAANLAELPLESLDQANDIKARMRTRFDDVQETIDDDDIYMAIETLRAALADRLTREAVDLPSVTEFTPGRSVPILVLAHEIFGDADKADDLIVRNNLSNPNKVDAGVPLEVLRG